jgi:RNA polymerase sigma-70 factor (ECF subfamily)
MRLTLAPDSGGMASGERRLADGDPLPPADHVPAPAAGVSLGDLYRAEAPGLLRYFERRTGERHAAPDLVHDAFARLAGIGALADLVNPAAYLQRIARNLLVDRARRSSAPAVLVSLEEWDAEIPAVQEDALVAQDLLQRYEEAIAGLPERTRTIFLLNRADDLTYRQIARRLGVTVWTVEYHMKRAILHLARVLDEQ